MWSGEWAIKEITIFMWKFWLIAFEFNGFSAVCTSQRSFSHCRDISVFEFHKILSGMLSCAKSSSAKYHDGPTYEIEYFFFSLFPGNLFVSKSWEHSLSTASVRTLYRINKMQSNFVGKEKIKFAFSMLSWMMSTFTHSESF